MATKNRIFISFAIEDARYRTMLVGQAKNEDSPFEFVDMSVRACAKSRFSVELPDKTLAVPCRKRMFGWEPRRSPP